ncbi:hypothetical protein BDR06DRAFT_1013620 [Suillus hirtellus]|nr:hypothetical protein BDR06DRAFT_1013620 [Suillus hirtellus]
MGRDGALAGGRRVLWEEGIKGRKSSILDILIPGSGLTTEDILGIRYIKRKGQALLQGASLLQKLWTSLQWRLDGAFSGPVKKLRRQWELGNDEIDTDLEEMDEDSILDTDVSWSQQLFDAGQKRSNHPVKTSEEKSWEHLLWSIYYAMCNIIREANEESSQSGSLNPLSFNVVPEPWYWSSEFATTPVPEQSHIKEPANVALICCGLLGCSPVEPSVAIELCTLELYHRLRHRHPQLSIQAMTRALCDIHDVNYRTCYRDQFLIAFDAYLCILQCIHSKVNQALGHGTKDWHAQNMCPCCMYELEDEIPLSPKILVSHDSNNSSKHVAGVGSADECQFHSSYFLSREQVDCFKDEIDENLASCLRWKSSGPDHKKTALDIYETTGIFVSACHHGFIIKVCEMVRSGELAKYPLAIMDALLNLYGQDIGVGYDVSCTFSEIVQDSPLLSTKAHDARITFCVNAFHGYAHNCLCQVQHHPMYLDGFGLEDLKTMECVFSASNAVSCTIHYATQYHWTQALNLHFQQWDDDKY